MLYNAKEFTIDTGTARTDCVSFGSGPDALVMIQGLNLRPVKGSGLPLAIAYKAFAKDYKVYVFDRRDPLPEKVTVKDLSDDIAQNMKSLGIEKADIFGVSQGGMIAQYLALDHPELVRSMVLGVTLCRSNPTVESVIGGWVGLAEKNDYKALVDDLMVKMYSDEYINRYARLFSIVQKTQKFVPAERFIKLAQSCTSCDTYDRLTEIKCPVLVLGGMKDKIVTPQASEEIAEKLGCEIYMYPGLGHSAYEEAKDFNARVLEFFRKHKNPPCA